MKRIISLLTLFLLAANAFAYDFSAVAPNGQTLYYNISGQTATVTYPYSATDDALEMWNGFAKPTGALVIPARVTYNSQSYAVTAVGANAFYGCGGITSVAIHDSLTTIGEAAFCSCSSLTEVTIGEGVTRIDAGAFYDCIALTHVNFNAVNCTTNSAHVFEYYDSINYWFAPNTNLTDVVIGNNVQRIPGKLLQDCVGISTITIPASVTTIGTRALSGCSGLTEIIAMPIVAPQLETKAFDYVNDSIPIFIRCGSLASYLSGWPCFSNFVEENAPYQLSVFSDNDEMGEVEIITIPDCHSNLAEVSALAREGFHFVRWSNGETDNPYTFTLTCDTVITAFFEADIPVQYTVTAESCDASMGCVTGSGTYDEGTLVTLTAIPNEGYRFVRWSNGATDNPYAITLIGDTIISALFEAVTTESIPDVAGVTILCHNGEIVIKGVVGEPVAIFNITGKLILSDMVYGDCTYALSERGVYLVKVGIRTARKVVIR